MSFWGDRARSADLVLPGGDRVPLVEVPSDPDPTEPGEGGGPAAEEQPWQLPAKGTPGRARMWCGATLALVVAYSFVLDPFRPMLLQTPLALAAITGTRTAMVLLGASVAVGRVDQWWLGLLIGTVSVVKFHPVFWWAGRLWGGRALAFTGGRGATSARIMDLARRWRVPAIIASYVVPGVPAAAVYAIAGATGMRLRTFLLVDVTAAFATRCAWLYLGFRLSQPVIDAIDAVIDLIEDHSFWVSIALVVAAVALPALRLRLRRILPDGR